MSSRVRRPETKMLTISRGDWLLVKKHLTAGEQRSMFASMMRAEGDRVDAVKVGLSKVATYLLDWSITDADDAPMVIRDVSTDAVVSALDALDTDSYNEILKAVESHIEAMEKERALEKNERDIASESKAISPSAA